MNINNSQINLTSREFKANPFPFYARLRAKAPVYRTILPNKQPVWLITRYEDVLKILSDPGFVKNRRIAMTEIQLRKQQWVPAFAKPLLNNMLDLDEPDHSRLRTLIQKAFTSNRVHQLRERVQIIADQLLDVRIKKRHMDVIHDYALPLSLTVIVEFLGIPLKDRDKFHRWSSHIVKATKGLDVLLAVPSLLAFLRYLRKIFANRRLHPRDDLLTALVQAEEQGDRLSEDELLAMVFLLLIAGHETTVNLIANGTLTLLQHPDQLAELKKNSQQITSTVEEILRYAGPLETATERFASQDISFAGSIIPRGEQVFAVLASANRDENHFESPDIFNIQREKNRHLAFGHGIHFCLGAPLARLEGQIGIQTLFHRLPDLKLRVRAEELRWKQVLVLRGLESLPVKF
jgi:cytochrome P450